MAEPSTGGGGGPDDPPMPPPDLSECRTPNFYVYEGLRPSCEGCHLAGTSVPSFANLESFERLVAYNPQVVVPQQPAASPLVAMLEGNGVGQNAQMPLGEQSFADLAASGSTDIGMAEIRDWIGELVACELPAPTDIPMLRRLRAEQVIASLTQQLGLDPNSKLTAPHRRRPVRTDEATWLALGGPNYLSANPRRSEVSSTFIEYLVPLSQRWCRESVDDNDALFAHTTRDSDSSTDLTAIRANIEFLYLHMLGVTAQASEIDGMTELYLGYEAQEDSRTAWTAVCATFIRDPRWLSY